ncbi:MAG: type IV pilus assembly protein PilM [Lentisphaeria bacterium]|nr:type IV pilus assembly protein PilM [Lentisphaeria bacterium]
MAKSSRVLALDIGAASIKLAEFAYGPGNSITLLSFDYREYGEELTEGTRGFVITSVLSDMLAAGDYGSKKALVSISGQYALTRFVPLPPVAEEESRVRQIVEFEARQNVPFPMEEVVWDYQLISNPGADELEVMFVVIKNEIVEEITTSIQNAGLEPVLVDVAPAAAYNAARANSIGDDGCAMLLNLGDRSTNLLFADEQQFFARTIPIAGHSISQQIGKEFSMDFENAEELKRRHGFVALGGAYAEPESEVAASVSKIVRNVMTRLHGEINRSIGVYRAQQKGNKPTKLYLTGGSSTMGFTDRFFEDKLGIPVTYFNPFQCVQMGPGIDTGRLQNVAHMFSEVVGLGLRFRGQCAVEVSLMPQTIVRQIALRRKKPYLLASVACVLLMMAVAWLAFARKDAVYSDRARKSINTKERLESTRKTIERTMSRVTAARSEYTFLESFLAEREKLPLVFNTIESLKPADLWLKSVKPISETQAAGAGSTARPADGGGESLFNVGGFEPQGSPGVATQEIGVEKITIAGFILEGESLTLKPEDLARLNPPVPETDGTEAAPAPSPSVTLLPAELFQQRLKDHPLFKKDGTAFVTYTTVSGIKNLKQFQLRVILETPIDIAFE